MEQFWCSIYFRRSLWKQFVELESGMLSRTVCDTAQNQRFVRILTRMRKRVWPVKRCLQLSEELMWPVMAWHQRGTVLRRHAANTDWDFCGLSDTF
jgi:hypothetical protein